MEQNKTTQKMSSSSTSQVKQLDVAVYISKTDQGTEVAVSLFSPSHLKPLIKETFPMLPNVPIETYIQYTFGKYNAFCSDKTENA